MYGIKCGILLHLLGLQTNTRCTTSMKNVFICPICDVTKDRQTHINAHLRSFHQVPLEKGNAGNIKALQGRQQQQFSDWLRRNKLTDRSLFGGRGVQEENEDDGEEGEEEDHMEDNGREDGKEDDAEDKESKNEEESKREEQTVDNGRVAGGGEDEVSRILEFIENAPDQSGLDQSPTEEDYVIDEDGYRRGWRD